MTPRVTNDGEAVAVRLTEALRQRAVVMWRTHADTMPDEAAALSVLALADLHDAAERAGAPWTLLLDEFGAVIKMAAQRGVAILQRGRSHRGQVIVITQSAADIEALTAQPGLLASLTNNFSGIVAHRQTAPESRDWLAKLMGTRALWQTTNQTTGHGSTHTGQGSARRVREFRIGSDVFSTLTRTSRDLHAAGRRPNHRRHQTTHTPNPHTGADRSRRRAAFVRDRDPSRRRAPSPPTPTPRTTRHHTRQKATSIPRSGDGQPARHRSTRHDQRAETAAGPTHRLPRRRANT